MFKALLIPPLFLFTLGLSGCAVGRPPPDPILADDVIKTEADAVIAAKRSCTGVFKYNPSEFLKWAATLAGNVWEVQGGSVEDKEIWTVRLSKKDGKLIEDGCVILIVD